MKRTQHMETQALITTVQSSTSQQPGRKTVSFIPGHCWNTQAPSTSDVAASPRLCRVSSSAAFGGQIPAGFDAWLEGRRSLHLLKERAEVEGLFPNVNHQPHSEDCSHSCLKYILGHHRIHRSRSLQHACPLTAPRSKAALICASQMGH